MRTPDKKAFTLIELLAVIAIIAVLAGIVISLTSRVRASARNATCVSNLRQLGIAISLYTLDQKGKLPTGWVSSTDNWMTSLVTPVNYLGTNKAGLSPLRENRAGVMFCPENVLNASDPSTSGATTNYGYNHYGLLNRRVNQITNPAQVCVLSENAIASGGNNWPNLLVEGNGSAIRMSATIHSGHSNVLYLDWRVGKISTIPAAGTEFWTATP